MDAEQLSKLHSWALCLAHSRELHAELVLEGGDLCSICQLKKKCDSVKCLSPCVDKGARPTHGSLQWERERAEGGGKSTPGTVEALVTE